MGRTVLLLRLLVVSYVPLLAAGAFQWSQAVRIGANTAWSWTAAGFWLAVALLSLGLCDGYRLPKKALAKGSVRYRVSAVREEGGAVAAYVLSYLLPLFGLRIDDWRDAASLSVFVASLVVIYIRTAMPAINPTLYFFGWRVYDCAIDGFGDRVFVLARGHSQLRPGDSAYLCGFQAFAILKQAESET